jgi:16S rRNA (cytidine1402-2'-O)-methyltransferase
MTVILYESPYRILKLLGEIKEHFGADRRVSISREISKIHEETLRGTPDELLEIFGARPPKGEFVVIIDKNSNNDEDSTEGDDIE